MSEKGGAIALIGLGAVFASCALLINALPYIFDIAGEIAIVVGIFGGIALVIWVGRQYIITFGNARFVNEENRLYLERVAIDNQRALMDLKVVQPLNNVLPVARHLIESGDLADQSVQLLSENIYAGRTHPNVPSSLHWSNKSDSTNAPEQIVEDVTPNASIPNFSELYKNSALGRGEIMLGYTEGQPLYANPHKLKSIVCGGLSGSGKSNTTRFLLAQYAMLGWGLAIFDPHGNSEEGILPSLMPLSNSFFMPPAIEHDEGMEMLRCVMLEGERRASIAGSKQSDFDPILFVIDEVAEFAAMASDEEREYAEKSLPIILKSFRKFNIFGFCISQFWSQSEMGNMGFMLRRAAQTSIIHRMPQDSAKIIERFGNFETIDNLPTGACLLNNTDIKRAQLQIPLCEQGHIEGVMPTSEATANHTAKTTAKTTDVLQIEDLHPPTMAVPTVDTSADVPDEHLVYLDAAAELTKSQRVMVERELGKGYGNGQIIMEVFDHTNKTNDRKGRKYARMINGVRIEMGMELPYSPSRKPAK